MNLPQITQVRFCAFTLFSLDSCIFVIDSYVAFEQYRCIICWRQKIVDGSWRLKCDAEMINCCVLMLQRGGSRLRIDVVEGWWWILKRVFGYGDEDWRMEAKVSREVFVFVGDSLIQLKDQAISGISIFLMLEFFSCMNPRFLLWYLMLWIPVFAVCWDFWLYADGYCWRWLYTIFCWRGS